MRIWALKLFLVGEDLISETSTLIGYQGKTINREEGEKQCPKQVP
jgi:hypothetical protein